VATKETLGREIASELRRELRREYRELAKTLCPEMVEQVPLGFMVEVGYNGTLPTKGSDDAAGYDLYAAQDVEIREGRVGVIPLGIKTAIPKGYYGRIADRSGLAYDYGLTVLGGVIDSDYRGEWKVMLLNTQHGDYFVQEGDRVAQVIITPCANFPVAEVSDLEATARGEGGFGSTGK